MKTYIKFLIYGFLKSFINIFLIIFSLIIIINLLSELDFFRETEVQSFFPIYLSFLNTPILIFEILPFLLLISTQLFFINLFKSNEIEIFKYTGLKNTKIIIILATTSLILGIFSVIIFYNISSNLKNVYLELKSQYSKDDKYLAVITKNGLWIKDLIDEKILIINSAKINNNFLLDNFISIFNKNYEIEKNISSEKINIRNKEWIIFKPQIYSNNLVQKNDQISIKTNFDYNKIQSLFSNLSSLSFLELLELKKNYTLIDYSTTEITIQIQKLICYPIYLMLITIFTTLIMINTKNIYSHHTKIATGLFFSVIIYYINNFFNAMGTTEKISPYIAIWFPLICLCLLNFIISLKINEK